MKDKNLRGAFKNLCKRLGFGYEIDLSDWNLDTEKWASQPVTYSEFREVQKKIDTLLDYLNLEICQGGEIKKKKRKRL